MNYMRWAELPLQQVAEVVSGFGFPKDYQGDTEGEYPFLKVSDMNLPGNEVWMYESTNTISHEALSKLGAKVFPPGTVIFPKIGAAIATGKKRILSKPSTFDNNVMGLVPRVSILASFLYYWSLTFDFQDIANIGPVPSLRKTTVEKLPIPLPPPCEQKRIVEILDQADALRKKRAEADEKSDRILPTLFLKMFGDPAINPKNWAVTTLEKIAKGDIRNGLSPSNKGTYAGEVLTLSAITQGKFDSSAKKVAKFAVKPPADKMVQKSDLLVCRGNGNLNLVGCARFPDKNYEDVLFPDTMIGVPINFSIITKEYLETLWSSDAMRSQIEQRARTTNGTHKINQKSLNDIQIMLPDFDLQKSFESAANKIQASIRKGLENRFKLESLFALLLHRAFSGELTAEWREAHMNEILQEMEHQTKVLGIPHTVEYEQLALSDLP